MELIIGSIPEADAYGGVIFSSDGKILLRKPKDHAGGYAWTYAQGNPVPGETPQQAALRKALEETGLKCRILADIAQLFSGTTTSTAFFLMVAEGEPGEFNGQTSAICWATEEEARALIGQSPSEVGRLRDLDILDHALILWHMDEGRYPHSYDPFNLQTVFEMVSILHGRGYEKLRIGPNENPSPYRLAVLPRKYFSVHHGAWVPSDGDSLFLSHSSELGGLVFRWIDADQDGPEQLADKYILRFPEEAAEGFGSDPAYAEWFQSLLAKTRCGGLPMTAIESLDYGPYKSPTLPISNPHEFWPDLTIPIPPPGENINSPLPKLWTTKTGFFTGQELNAEFKYLGSPSVVSAIILQIIKLSCDYYKGDLDYLAVWEDINVEVLSLTYGEDGFGYTLEPDWHHPAGIGRALLKYFQLRPEDDFADKMDYLWHEALMALFFKTRDLLIAYRADPLATWDEQLPPPIAALHDWTVSVLLGTNVLFAPDRVIGDFR